jgi:plastocyanin
VRAAIAIVVLALLAVAAAPAAADTVQVGIIAPNAFVPPLVTAVAGDRVVWHNGTLLEHTVTGPDFDSGHIVPGGNYFHDVATPGTVRYVCTIHAFMVGDLNVVRVLLDGPARPVARNVPVALSGRVAAGVGAVTIEEDEGTGFHGVASAPVQDGQFHATVRPAAPALYRAVAGPDASPPVQVQVTDKAALRLTPAAPGLSVVAQPPIPGAQVALQLRLRERFGWWTVARRRLDRRGRASFPRPGRGGVRARVALLAPDGWTQLSVSRAIRLPRR